MKTTSDATAILGRMLVTSPAIEQALRKADLNFDVAQMIYDARSAAGLTQRELASLVGTRQSVIARLEDAEYQGHSLSMLQRIAVALGRRVEVRFTRPRSGAPVRGGAQASGKRTRRVA